MNHRSDIDRVLQVWMTGGPDAIPDRVVDVVAARIAVQRQRRAWPFHGRTNVTTQIKLIAALAAVLVLAVVGYNLLPDRIGPGSPSTAPTASAQPPIRLAEGPLSPGRYVTEVPGVEIEFVLPPEAQGWEGGDAAFLGVPPMADPPHGVFLGFNTVSLVPRDPCLNHVPKPVGDRVADIAKVWSALPRAEIVGPTDMDVSGFSGVRFEMQIDDDLAECEVEALALYLAGGFVRVVGAGQHVELWAIDVEGTRLIVEASSFPEAGPEDLSVLEKILDSIELASTE